MSLITVINLSLTFSGRSLFHDIGFQVEPGDKMGLVGPNGSGKTTLLRLLAGEISPDSGETRISKVTRVGYLPQNVQKISGLLLQSILDSIPGRARFRTEIKEIEESLKNNLPAREQEKLAAGLAELHHEMSELNRQYPAHRAEKILVGLGFKPEDFSKPVASLSGGWRMRAALGGLLYQNPDLLLLDEPTNHLDIPSIRWLEQFLQEYTKAMILICHDRDFMNRQIRRVISFEQEGLRFYTGNYDFYLKTREEERKILKASARNQELKIKEARKFIERFQAKATKARQAQSKIKLLKKMDLVKTHRKEKTVRFSFPEVSRSGRVVVDIQGVSKGFDKHPLYNQLDMKVLRGERVAIIGTNGTGKTTLLRMLSGEIAPDHGRLTLGHGVRMSYYAQHHSEMLDSRKSIIEEVYQVVPHETTSFVRGVCGAFLFSGQDVDKTIGVLSGGEKARVCLAKILVKPGNLIVMDEPTNHLDLMSSEILIDALADFKGTLLFASHNQSFINRLATKIWDIRDGGIIEYPGTLYEYYDHLSKMKKDSRPTLSPEVETGKNRVKKSSSKDHQSRKTKRRQEAEKRLLISTTLRPIQSGLSQLEERIAGLESREKELGEKLADPDTFKDKSKSLPLLSEYGEIKKELKELMQRWEHNQFQLESVKKELGVPEGDVGIED